MNIYISKKELSQKSFDRSKELIQEHVLDNGFGYIFLCDHIIPECEETLMEGYWDIDDEGQTTPHFWYNKEILDENNIKY